MKIFPPGDNPDNDATTSLINKYIYFWKSNYIAPEGITYSIGRFLGLHGSNLSKSHINLMFLYSARDGSIFLIKEFLKYGLREYHEGKNYQQEWFRSRERNLDTIQDHCLSIVEISCKYGQLPLLKWIVEGIEEENDYAKLKNNIIRDLRRSDYLCLRLACFYGHHSCIWYLFDHIKDKDFVWPVVMEVLCYKNDINNLENMFKDMDNVPIMRIVQLINSLEQYSSDMVINYVVKSIYQYPFRSQSKKDMIMRLFWVHKRSVDVVLGIERDRNGNIEFVMNDILSTCASRGAYEAAKHLLEAYTDIISFGMAKNGLMNAVINQRKALGAYFVDYIEKRWPTESKIL